MQSSRNELIPARWSIFLIALLAGSGLYACVCDLALIWDGGAQFCYTLSDGAPYAYFGRFFSVIIWQPVIWATHFTDNLAVLRFLYGLPLCIAPAVSAVLCFWIAGRSRPDLLLWALPGICISAIPTQVFIINESTFQQTLFWPVMLGFLVPLTISRRIVMGALLVFQFSHPQGLVLMVGATVLLWGLGMKSSLPDAAMFRRRAKWMLGLSVLCLAKVVLTPDPYAVQEAGIWPVWVLFKQGLQGWQLVGWFCFVGATCLAMQDNKGFRRWILRLVVFAMAVWIYWAADSSQWTKALDARRFALPLALPFYFGLWWMMSKGERAGSHLSHLAAASVVIFSAVISIQATAWRRQYAKVITSVEYDPRSILPSEDFTELRDSIMDHWGLGAQVIARSGGRKLVLDEAGRKALLEVPPRVTLGINKLAPIQPGATGWFDFSEAVKRGQSMEINVHEKH